MVFSDFNIDVNPHGPVQQKTICPKCKEIGKQHWKDKCLSVNIEEGIWKCHKCEWTGTINRKMMEEKSITISPARMNEPTALKPDIIKWFQESRGISRETLERMGINQTFEIMPQTNKKSTCIRFEYRQDDKIINVKFRDRNKNFKLIKGAELIFYNQDVVEDNEEIIICEGEIDVLSYIEAGFNNSLSVPNGASVSLNGMGYLDKSIEKFEKINKIYLAVDNDSQGMKLRAELARRFGNERCYKVDFKDCKDANEFLVKYGKDELRKTISGGKLYPIEGVFSLPDYEDDLDNVYQNGFPEGLKIGIKKLDELITFEKGRLCTITGIPGHGKSEFLDFIIERLAVIHGYKFALFSPENHPLWLHASKFIEKIIGKRFDNKNLSKQEFINAKAFLQNHFYFIQSQDESFTMQMILEKAKSLIQRHGIHGLVIDPWNRIEYQNGKGMTETNYISQELTRLTTFAKTKNIIVFLVAHPTKIQKDRSTDLFEIPNLYSISGSANFFNKTDIGITVYRNLKTDIVTVYIQKLSSPT